MLEKLNNRELILFSNVRVIAKRIEKIAPCIGFDGALRLSNQLADIASRCSDQRDIDIFPIDMDLNDFGRQVRIRAALIMALPRGYVLRDIVVNADGENSGYRKVCAVREEFADAPLNQDTNPKVFAGYGGLVWCENDWVPVSSFIER